MRQLEEASCPNCEHPVDRTYLRCPNCRARIKDPCESCSKPIDPRWSICPYCEAPTRRAAPQPERRAASAGTKVKRPARAKRPVARSTDGRGEPRAAPKQRPAAAKARQSARRAKSSQSTQSGSRPRPEPGDDAPPRTAPAP